MAFEITEADFIDLLRRTTDDDGWLQPILDHPDSRIVLQAVIAIVQRSAEAASRGCDVGLISTAPAGVVGTSTVTIQQDGSQVTAAGTLPAGTRFVDARGYLYELLVEVAVPAGDNFVTNVSVLSLRETELVNTVDDPDMRFSPATFVSDATNATPIVIKTSSPHGYVTGDLVRITDVEGNTAANGVHTVTVLDGDEFELDGTVGNGDFLGASGVAQPAPFTLIITEATPVTNGLSDYLSTLAAERGLIQQNGESDGLFRQRTLQIPDAVSPCAISDVVLSVAQNLGLADPEILEPFDLGETPTLKEEKALGTGSNAFFDHNHLDDPINGKVNSAIDFTTAFEIQVAPGDVNVATGAFMDSADVVRGFFDGLFFYDSNVQAQLETALATLRQEVEVKKAHAVPFDLLLKDVIVRHDALGDTTLTGADELVWTLIPPAGSAWHLWHVLTGLSFSLGGDGAFYDDGFTDGSIGTGALAKWFFGGGGDSEDTIEQFIRFTFSDATTFDLPRQIFLGGETGPADVFRIGRLKDLGFPFKPITLIEGYAKDSIIAVRMVSHLWLVEFVL